MTENDNWWGSDDRINLISERGNARKIARELFPQIATILVSTELIISFPRSILSPAALAYYARTRLGPPLPPLQGGETSRVEGGRASQTEDGGQALQEAGCTALAAALGDRLQDGSDAC